MGLTITDEHMTIHYLPGCDVKIHHQQAINKIQNYMIQRGALIERCCRVKEELFSQSDLMVQNCTLCQIILQETHPQHHCLSLYEYVLSDPYFPYANHQGETITIQDCWRTRHDTALHQTIRLCLQKMNYTIVEMAENKEQSRFCGVWLYNEPTPQCIDIAPKTFHDIIAHHLHLLPLSQQEELMKEWVKQYTTKQILVYCNGCEKGIKMGGKQPIHMVELLSENLP